jgi:FixJ family two-component response regulator
MRVGVVDDDVAVLNVIGEILRHAGYFVRTFDKAPPCIDAVCRGELDFIFTDINMPEMSGVELLRTVKELRDDVEVVMMTADARLESAIQATRWGAVDYVEKPFTDIEAVSNLAHRVAERVREKRHARAIIEQHAAESAQGFRLAGSLAKDSLPQLLEVIASMGRDGVLHLDGSPAAQLFIRAGCISHVSLPPLKGEKALYRLLREASGAYRLGPYEPPSESTNMGKPVRTYVLEGMRRKGEFARIAAQLPMLDGEWSMASDCRATLSQLAPWLVGVLADVIRGKSARAALESASYFDLDILSGLLYLWQLGAIKPSEKRPTA